MCIRDSHRRALFESMIRFVDEIEIIVGDRSVLLSYDDYDEAFMGMTIFRKAFDQRLLDFCNRLGVNVVIGCGKVGWRTDGDRVVVSTKDGSETYDYVIVATGAATWNCWGDTKMITCVEWTSDARTDRFVLYFDKKLFKMGYAWAFPYVLDKALIGFGELSSEFPSRKDEIRDESFKVLGSRLHGRVYPVDFYGGFVVKSPSSSKDVVLHDRMSRRILYTGTAAGFIDPTTGGGILYAVLSGKAVAESVSRSPRLTALKYKLKTMKLRTAIDVSARVRKLIESSDNDRLFELLEDAACMYRGRVDAISAIKFVSKWLHL